MNVLVTGGAGFIGSHTVVVLQEHGYRPIILDDLSNSDKATMTKIKDITQKECTFYEGSCNDPSLLSKIFEEEDIDGVIHFAAYKAVGESVQKPLDYYHNNINSLINILRAMQDFEVSNLVFSSSCTIYGIPDQLPVTESSPVKPPNSPYGNTKQICEEIIRDVSNTFALKALNLRYFNPIGAHPSGMLGELPLGTPNNLIPYITQTAAGIRSKLSIFGNDYGTPDGTCIRDYIHVMDLAEAHLKALIYLSNIKEDTHDEAINVGTGSGNSVQEVVDTFMEVTGVNLPYEIAPRRSGDVPSIYAETSKSQQKLGWSPQYTLRDALAHAWAWQKNLNK